MRARLLGLGRPRAATAHHRRQAEAGQDIEDGPARPETTPGHGSHGGYSAREPTQRDHGSVAGRDAGVQAEEGGRGGARQQDGAEGLGAGHEKGGLPGSRCRLSGQRKEKGERRETLPGDGGEQDAGTE